METSIKKCPMCAEEIPLAAVTCEYCGAQFEVTSTGYCQNCHQVREADGNGKCKVCGNVVTDLRVGSKFIEDSFREVISPPKFIPQPETRKTGGSRFGFGFLAGVLVFAVISALLWLGRNGVPAVSGLFATNTPTTTATLTPTSTPTRTPTPTPDPRRIFHANQHKYLYVQENKTWHQAKDDCSLRGGHLVTIQDAAENDYVYRLTSGQTWLGATDEEIEGVWVWITGETWSFRNWDQGEPNDFQSEDFLTFSIKGPISGLTWNDQPADGEIFFVCEWEE